MGEKGPPVMTLDDYCRLRYGLEKGQMPTKSQRNSVSHMCRVGSIPAFKHGHRWFIRLEDQ